MEQYCYYGGIDDKYFRIFEKLWDTYRTQLPEIKPVLQDEEAIKLNVFYLWVNYYAIDGMFFYKADRMMLNSTVSILVDKLKKYMPYEIVDELEGKKSDEVFVFLYVYHVIKFLYQHLDDFVQAHDVLKNYPIRRPRMYTMKDDDFEPGDKIYVVLKMINFEFIQTYLTQNRCYEIHLMALYFTKSFLNYNVSLVRTTV